MSSQCRSCGAEIVWAIAENGVRIALDARGEPRFSLLIDHGELMMERSHAEARVSHPPLCKSTRPGCLSTLMNC